MRSSGPPARRDGQRFFKARQMRFDVRSWRPHRAPRTECIRARTRTSGAGAAAGAASGRLRLARTRRSIGDGFQKIRVAPRHLGPSAFRLHPLARPRAQRLGELGPAHQQVQILKQVVFFARIHRRLQADGFGKFAERADLGNDHRLAQSQRAHQRSGIFSHRGIAQIQHDIAGRQIADSRSADAAGPGTRRSGGARPPAAPRGG